MTVADLAAADPDDLAARFGPTIGPYLCGLGGGGTDRFRISISDLTRGNVVVYDNQTNAPGGADPTTGLGGGSIVIHKK